LPHPQSDGTATADAEATGTKQRLRASGFETDLDDTGLTLDKLPEYLRETVDWFMG
jgi:hypothetical protein